MLYELLAGTRPFRPSEKLAPREQTSQLLELVKTFDPRPPRQVNDDVPKELERVCLKALAKRKPDRYTTARDMAEDLRHFASNPAAQDAASVRVQLPRGAETGTPAVTPGGHTPSVPSNTPQVISDREPLKIVPKGLRSFDAGDASFFLDLLPGQRDRDGLPESVRFWKTRLESLDPDVTFASGVLYGPSGCGKSTLLNIIGGLLAQGPRDPLLAAARGVVERLLPSVRELRDALDAKARAFDDVVKIGRTHLMDATPIRVGQVFGGYAAAAQYAAQPAPSSNVPAQVEPVSSHTSHAACARSAAQGPGVPASTSAASHESSFHRAMSASRGMRASSVRTGGASL